MGIPQNNFKRAFDSLIHAKVVEVDTLSANGYLFMRLADIGFNPHIVKLYNKSDSRGLSTYIRFVLQEYFKYNSHYYEVETDKGSFSGHTFMITIAYSRQFGSCLPINPDEDWSDGQFGITIIKTFPKRAALKLFWRLLTKKIKYSPNSVMLKCNGAKINCRNERTLQYDGEVAGKFKEVNISMAHHNLQIITP